MVGLERGEDPWNVASKNMKESAFETVKNELVVLPIPHTLKELQKLINMVAYMLPYCGHIYNVILDINSALSTTNVINYYDDIVILDGYPTHHDDNVYSTKATVSASDYKKSLNNQNHTSVLIEEVNEENTLPNIIVNNDITEDHHVLIDKTTPSHSFQN
ncbi:hypothetical protein M422DRAFT_249269 [Sphaerobolus stellatus SS14]|uniref:Uncharacterized protein n=1 Tax=Sphaerobolus stellatus (strain SS14) TaxID=990650 RepID=A0A0C9VI58_SPHS4|nr:hypothetical protein M422DRAFT_249269 [Sphaerobolus stellatus SS14]